MKSGGDDVGDGDGDCDVDDVYDGRGDDDDAGHRTTHERYNEDSVDDYNRTIRHLNKHVTTLHDDDVNA